MCPAAARRKLRLARAGGRAAHARKVGGVKWRTTPQSADRRLGVSDHPWAHGHYLTLRYFVWRRLCSIPVLDETFYAAQLFRYPSCVSLRTRATRQAREDRLTQLFPRQLGHYTTTVEH